MRSLYVMPWQAEDPTGLHAPAGDPGRAILSGLNVTEPTPSSTCPGAPT